MLNALGWEVYPDGLSALLIRLHTTYGLPLLITENGMPERQDTYRASFVVAHLERVQNAIDAGVNVLGYLHWSLVDNFEWAYNYDSRARFGLIQLDRTARDASGGFRRRLTRGALAFKYLAEPGDQLQDRLMRARDRFGAVSAPGDTVDPPTKSPGALWTFTSGGQDTLLYLTRLSGPGQPPRLAGMLFDGGLRRWIRLEEVSWNPASGQLTLFHPPSAGAPEREFSASLVGDNFEGAVTQGGQTTGWAVFRSWLEGLWNGGPAPFETFSFTTLSRWELPGPPPGLEIWQGMAFTQGGGTRPWRLFEAVTVTQSTVRVWELGSQVVVGTEQLRATLNRDTMTGIITAGNVPWQATRASDDVLA